MKRALGGVLAVFMTACGGGGGGDGGSTPAPTVTLGAAVASVTVGSATTLTWSSTNATSCTASGAWSGSRATSGSESTGALTAPATFTLTCTGSGGSASASTTVSVASLAIVTVSGTLTYARVPHSLTPGGGLDYQNTRQEPARGITVEVIDAATQAVRATTSTDPNGAWSASVPGSTDLIVRARAELLRPAGGPLPHWHVTVGDTETGVASYTFDSSSFNSGSGAVQDVAIPSGWDPAARVPIGTRASAPFAILDSIYRALEFVTSSGPDLDFPYLAIDWSPQNVGGETFYSNDNGQPRIVLCGQADVDIDEFDAHTIIHEFGHYLEDRFSRSDSPGGAHAFGDILDPRLAFGEGWGYAFAAMVLNDPVVRDAAGRVQGNDSNFSVETDTSRNPGWFSEASVQEILWDLFDPANESNDDIEIGFGPIWTVMTGEQRTTQAFTTLFSFMTRLKELTIGVAPAIDSRVAAEQVTAGNMDIYGTSETHVPAGTAQVPEVLPIYSPISIGGGGVAVRTTDAFDAADEGNRLSTHRFLRLDVPTTQSVRITAAATVADRDVDIYVVRSGSVVASGTGTMTEDFTATLEAGHYVIDVLDCGIANCGVPVVTGTSDIVVTIAPN